MFDLVQRVYWECIYSPDLWLVFSLPLNVLLTQCEFLTEESYVLSNSQKVGHAEMTFFKKINDLSFVTIVVKMFQFSFSTNTFK